MSGRTWLRHPETGGAFHCPDEAVEDWRANGWVPGEAPAEVNPAIAERIAYERAQAAAAAAQEPAANAAQPTTTRAARRGESSGVTNG